jgi:two-component system, NtrC family, sensor kinase
MGRRAKPAKVEADAKRPLAHKAPKKEGARVHELEKRLAEALEQQTATSEILRVISSSPTDVQPVFDAIAESAARLCEANDAEIYRVDGDVYRRVAHRGPVPIAGPVGEAYPISRGRPSSRAIIDRQTIHVHDQAAEIDTEFPDLKSWRQVAGVRTILATPMLRDDVAMGVIVIRRTEVNPFSGEHIELLKTFADQAIIAIENVRLFKELEVRNTDLTEALEQQTATAEILRVISRSQSDVQPVFDTIVRSAVRLCNGLFSALFRFDGELIHHVTQHNYTPEALEASERVYPTRPTRALWTGRVILERAAVHIPDVELDLEHQHLELPRAIGFRSGLFVPMLREGEPIGVIMVARAEAGLFSDSEIALLKTFADQAVIAVENVRLFKELQARTGELTRSVEKLTALGEVSRAVSSTLDVETVLNTIVSRASQLAGAAGCSIYEYDEGAEQFELRATHNYDAAFVEALRAAPLRKGEGLMGRAAEMREPVQIPDITQPGAYQSSVRDTLMRFGYRALLSVPLLRENQIIGSLSFNRKAPGAFPPEVVDVLKTFATQSALAIQNARLFREIGDKSRQLEAASRHKSEFLANMSHELRTPLNAIIGFSEVLAEKMFGDVNDKQAEYLQDILESGRHLLSLINDILDLSKIEAGHMELEPADFDLPSAIDNALILVRERASRRGITLGSTIDAGLGMIRGDERKVKQVLLNLLSNALKFTPEGGRIDVRASLHDEVAEVSVADTGIGIAPADQDVVFEEFRQVGTVDKKAEGTGLGLTLARKFIELHGGRIWVKSQVGIGSTFTFTLPLRRGDLGLR